MEIIFSKQAIKFLKKQNKVIQRRLVNAIYQIPKGDIKPLMSKKPYKRLRVGTYRVIFTDMNHIINIHQIGNRGDVYK